MKPRSLSIRIAFRYLFSRKSHAAVNVLSYISMAGVAIAATAMVIVLSVFNGFYSFTAERISHFSAPLLVTTTSGRLIADADSLASVISGAQGVADATPVITERAFAICGERQTPLVLCGIDPEGNTARSLPGVTIDGDPVLIYDDEEFPNTAISSVGVANALRSFPAVPVYVRIYEPRRNARINPANPLAAFRCDSLIVDAVYRIDQNEYDNDFMFVPLAFARNLLGYTTEADAIEISVGDEADIDAVRDAVARIAGPGYKVADRMEQQHDSFRMINVEKWITLVMLTFILVVATFNVLSIMSIMIIEKRGNSTVLLSLGATSATISGIYGWLSMLITSIGGVIGIVIGVILSLLQQIFGFIKLIADDPSQLSIDAYPVRVAPTDILIVTLVILGIGFLSALVTRYLLRPAR
ncbi:MAG: ABC transporter permease [Muribaculaceae bacterium]|nr:ABC transporter permease [Muribaculaceae bacterium]